MLPTSLRHTLSVLAAAAILAGPATLTATSAAAEEMSANAKAQKVAKARREAMAKRKRARAAKARRAKEKAARAKAAKEKAAMERAAKAMAAQAKAKKREMAKKPKKPKMAKKPETAKKPEMAKKPAMAKKPDTASGKQTQTALGAQPMTKLAKLVRTIKEHIAAGEADGSLTKGELAQLASLQERVEIMDRMSRNDENFSAWERHYLETANTILEKIVQRHRLDREMSVEPRYIEMRIQRGLQDGTLTEQQAENLREIQRRVLVARNEADQGGTLSPKDKARYMRAQYRLSDLLNHTRRYGPVARTLGQSGFKAALERGVKNGSFSRAEARELWRTHQRIRGLREKAIADGKITPLELTVLNNRLKAERHRLSYGQRAAYRRSLRMRRARMAHGRSGGSGAGRDAAMRGAAAVRNYGRAVGSGMRNLGRMFGR
jgi:hypothetical protein